MTERRRPRPIPAPRTSQEAAGIPQPRSALPVVPALAAVARLARWAAARSRPRTAFRATLRGTLVSGPGHPGGPRFP